MLRRRRPPAPLGFIGPESLEVFARTMRAGDTWFQSFAIGGYPREVSPGWLNPLLSYPGAVDIALHAEPIPNGVAATHLRRQMSRLESTRRIDLAKSRLPDPEIETAVGDATEMAGKLARGDGRLFKVGLYVTVRAASPEALEAEVHKVRAVAASLLLDSQPTTFRSKQGWLTTLPLGLDLIELRRTFDTASLASCFPFASADVDQAGGILYGRNRATGGLVFCDRFSLDNYNQVILASSGKGKSYLTKLMILRSLYQGIEVLVVDPEREYQSMTRAVGGTELWLGTDGERLNPLDLTNKGSAGALFEQALFVHLLVELLVGSLSAAEKAGLDKAILDAYRSKGITSEPRTHNLQAPVLFDVSLQLSKLGRAEADLAKRLQPYICGSYRGLFDTHTTVRPEGHLVVFSLKDAPTELKPAAALMALETIWRRVTQGERRPRIVVVDEAWQIMNYLGTRLGADYLLRLAKSARKHWCGLTTITQNLADVMSTDLGQSIVTNASTKILLGQDPMEIETLSSAFNLSEGESSYLTSCEPGNGLFLLGNHQRVPLQVIASDEEHSLVTSNPAEISLLEAVD